MSNVLKTEVLASYSKDCHLWRSKSLEQQTVNQLNHTIHQKTDKPYVETLQKGMERAWQWVASIIWLIIS
jgi:hypothetical protein